VILFSGRRSIIIDYAKANKMDLIVMSTHGRSGLSRWTLGSVTDKVVRHGGMPVLTVT
jgi:nucleotide-binding universal stress UspA family protein